MSWKESRVGSVERIPGKKNMWTFLYLVKQTLSLAAADKNIRLQQLRGRWRCRLWSCSRFSVHCFFLWSRTRLHFLSSLRLPVIIPKTARHKLHWDVSGSIFIQKQSLIFVSTHPDLLEMLLFSRSCFLERGGNNQPGSDWSDLSHRDCRKEKNPPPLHRVKVAVVFIENLLSKIKLNQNK